jgi:cation:H+ antiporter
MPPALVGLTVVAAATSVPELAVSLMAAIRGSSDIAVGNVVGSNIANITLILGLGAIIAPLAIGGNVIKFEYPVLAIVTFQCLVLAHDGILGRLDGVLMIAIYVLFTVYTIILVRGKMTPREAEALSEEAESLTKGESGISAAIRYTTAGIVLLGVGAQCTVTGAIDIAKYLGMSDRIVGLTIVAVGTSLPEITATILSTLRGRSDVAIGNAIGSNLFNILVILGFTAVFNPIGVSPDIIASDNWWMLGTTLLLYPLMITSLTISRFEGWLLISTYLVYTSLLVFL